MTSSTPLQKICQIVAICSHGVVEEPLELVFDTTQLICLYACILLLSRMTTLVLRDAAGKKEGTWSRALESSLDISMTVCGVSINSVSRDRIGCRMTIVETSCGSLYQRKKLRISSTGSLPVSLIREWYPSFPVGTHRTFPYAAACRVAPSFYHMHRVPSIEVGRSESSRAV